MEPSLRIEIFTADVAASAAFLRETLGFDERYRQHEGSRLSYIALDRGVARIGVGAAWEAVDPQARHVPRGAEIVLEVDDIEDEYRRVMMAGWPVEGPPQKRPWGLTDFRLSDPNGYYFRITNR
ncbi:hypothetical protein GCM10029976_091520 [Kribbella albertanoniae]|uniref:VOC family protein n=1 Tax=Kribbella albertanoniae TaxID=1266829 RepID=A0A4R4PSY5_9ACTN|nr:VOC family protein [Kribbella albertanoniae]TDC25446.1 VOC family protein [Kribbella albertanoniae]